MCLLAVTSGLCWAQTPIPANRGFTTVRGVMIKKCLACHDWAGTYKGLTDPSRTTPRSPDDSPLYLSVVDDSMPPAGSGAPMTPQEKALLRAWIAEGAPSTDAPITAQVPAPRPPAKAQAPRGVPSVPSPAAEARPRLSPLFPGELNIHKVSGFSSAALLLAAGIVGNIHFVDMLNQAHTYAESIGFDPLLGPESLRIAEVQQAWNDPTEQALRWVHIGLLSSGEALYLFNAYSGIRMWNPRTDPLGKSGIHRSLFIGHAALMIAQIGLGIVESIALKQGDHDLMVAAGTAHIAIGYAIPLLIVFSGLENR